MRPIVIIIVLLAIFFSPALSPADEHANRYRGHDHHETEKEPEHSEAADAWRHLENEDGNEVTGQHG